MNYSTDRALHRKALAALYPFPIVLAAHRSMQAKSDMAYKFTQEPSFLYLTGINEPDWMLIYDTTAWHLVKPYVSEVHEIFDGSLSIEEAIQLSGITSVLSHTEGEVLLSALSRKYETVVTIGGDPMASEYDFVLNSAGQLLGAKLENLFTEVVDCRPELKKMRAVKTRAELNAQQEAIDVTIDAFDKLKKSINSAAYEYELEAQLNAAFRVTGASGHAYDPIVAGGKNACTLHYGKNQDKLPKNGLVLIDAGTQVGGYCADITRTYAIGMPSDREKAVHAAVERAHHSIIALIEPGVSFESYSHSVDEIMKDALESLGLLKDRTDTKVYRTYFPHAISHGLGIDVHESLGGYKAFMAGMVLTVEPGIYIPEEAIGVRIEDNILVTEAGTINLSQALSTGL